MTALLARQRPLLLFALASLVVSTACLALTPGLPTRTPTASAGFTPQPGLTPAAGTPTAPASTPVAPAATPPSLVVTNDQGRVSVVVPGDVAFGPGAFDWVDAGAGLANLSSYTASLSVAFAGTQAGQAQQWSKTYILLSARQPSARQLTIAKTGDNADPAPVFLAEVAGAAYEQRGTRACTASALDPAYSLVQPLEPAGFLTGVIGADAAGSDTVNGLAADHYTFDERALGLDGRATASGELWVASSGGYLLKYVLKTQGDANYFGEGLVGTLTLDYELTGANQPVQVSLPPDCPAGMLTAPRLPDAAHVASVPGLLAYDTAATLAAAAAYYQQQLPGLGWTQSRDPITADTFVNLAYTRSCPKSGAVTTAPRLT